MDPFVIVIIILMFALAFGIGSNDETMAPLVGSRTIKFSYVIMVGSFMAFIGVVLLSSRVGKMIGENLLSENVEYNALMMLSVIVSTTIWLIVASRTGAPISTTHSVVGAVFGIAIVWGLSAEGSFIGAINWIKMLDVVLGWVFSPILGFFGAYFIQLLVSKFIKTQQAGLKKLEKMEKNFLYYLVVFICWTQISRGGNDSANALGIMYGLSPALLDPQYYLLLTILTGFMLALGLIVVGRNVIKNVGKNLIEMRPSDAFSIQVSTSIVLFLATILGLPVSGSHILIFAIIGAGRVKGERPDRKSFRKMIISWIITFPVAASLSSILYLSLQIIF